MSYGCHNRPAFAEWMLAQDGWESSWARRMLLVPLTNTRDCQYTQSDLGKKDPGCKGCIHKLKAKK